MTRSPSEIEFVGTSPVRSHASDAGADLFAAHDAIIPPGRWVTVGTGTRVNIPDGRVGYVTPRSGMAAKHGVTVLNAPGTIDAGYIGEVKVVLMNHGTVSYAVSRGEKVAQLVVHECVLPVFVRVDRFGVTERGERGFGSTGR